MIKTVIEAAIEEEMADHLGYDKHSVEGRNRANSQREAVKAVLTDTCGEVEIDFPRDREARNHERDEKVDHGVDERFATVTQLRRSPDSGDID